MIAQDRLPHELMTNARLLIKPREFVLWSGGSSTTTEHSENEEINFQTHLCQSFYSTGMQVNNVAEYGKTRRKVTLV